MNGDLSGKSALVTGASSGIGRAIALALADAGADVLVHARANRDGADEVAQLVCGKGRKAHTFLADLADSTAREELIAATGEAFPKLDILVNNAGADILTEGRSGWPFEKKLEALWRVDVQATIAIARTIGRQMRSRGSGAILCIGWDGADHGMEGDSAEAFAAAKGAIMAFSRSLACSLSPEVRVNCLAPGWIKTAWGESASQAWQDRAAGQSLLGRWGTPDEIASAARFLVSDESSFLTGQVIHVNGGRR